MSAHSPEEIGVLHAAAQQGRTDVINAVITELGKSRRRDIPIILSTPRDLDCATPLHLAAIQGNVDVCRALLHAGVDVRTEGTRAPFQGKTAYMVSKTAECVQAFVMETFKAVANGNAGRVHELIQSGVSVQCTSGTPPHDSLLHWACYYGNDEVVDALIKLGAKINQKNGEGATPLHEASRNGHVKIALHLLIHGADYTIKGTSGYSKSRTPIEVASNAEMQELLMNVKEEDFKQEEEEDRTILPQDHVICDDMRKARSESLESSYSFSSAADCLKEYPLLWPPPRTCLRMKDVNGYEKAFIPRHVVVVLPEVEGDLDIFSLNGIASKTIYEAFTKYGMEVLFLKGSSWKARMECSMEPRAFSINVVISRDLFSCDQSYTLLVTATSIELTASDLRGALYGVWMLRDLVKYYGEEMKAHEGKNIEGFLSLPTVCIKDHPDFPTRGVILDSNHSTLINNMVLEQLFKWRITSVHLSLPLSKPIKSSPVPSSREDHIRSIATASYLLQLDHWAKSHLVELIPTIIIKNAEDVEAISIRNAFHPSSFLDFSSKQISLVFSWAGSGEELESQAFILLHWLKEILSADSSPGLWIIHLWGLPSTIAEELQNAWPSRGANSFSICAHYERISSSPLQGALRKALYVIGGGIRDGEAVFLLRRVLLRTLQSAEGSLTNARMNDCERPSGFFVRNRPFNNTLYPLLISHFVTFFSAGVGWNFQGVSNNLYRSAQGQESGENFKTKNCQPNFDDIVDTFITHMSNSPVFRSKHSPFQHPESLTSRRSSSEILGFDGPPTKETYKSTMREVLDLLLSFGMGDHGNRGDEEIVRDVFNQEKAYEEAENSLWRMCQLQDILREKFDDQQGWKDNIIQVHRFLHSISKCTAAVRWKVSRGEGSLSSSSSKLLNADVNQTGEVSSAEDLMPLLLMREFACVTQLMKQVGRFVIHCLSKIDPHHGKVKFTFIDEPRQVRSKSKPEKGQKQQSALFLASPDLLPSTSRYDIANGLLDVYEESLAMQYRQQRTGARQGLRASQQPLVNIELFPDPSAVARKSITQLMKNLQIEGALDKLEMAHNNIMGDEDGWHGSGHALEKPVPYGL